MTRIKVFSTASDPSRVGDYLTKEIDEWIAEHDDNIEILHVHTTCNKFGWMITITYNVK